MLLLATLPLRCTRAPTALPGPPPTPPTAVAGLEGDIGKLLATARAVQQQYSIRPAGGEQAVEQPPKEGGDAAAAAADPPPGGDVAMREAGQI